MRLGRYLKPDMAIKITPKAGSRKRKGSPPTVNKKVAIFYSCIRRNDLLVRLSDLDGWSRMILRWLKSMKKPSWSGSANSNKPSGRKRLSHTETSSILYQCSSWLIR